MKKGLLFRLVLSLVLLGGFFDLSYAQLTNKVEIDGKIQFKIETKTMSQSEAEALVAGGGSIDLLLSVVFSDEFLTPKNHLANMKFNPSAISFKIVDESGTLLTPAEVEICESDGLGCGHCTQGISYFATSIIWNGICPTYAYGGQLSGTTTMDNWLVNGKNNEAKMLKISFKIKTAKTFYVELAPGFGEGGSTGDFACNLVQMSNSWPFVWPGNIYATDWFKAESLGRFTRIKGGLVITKGIEMPTFKVTQDDFCPQDNVTFTSTVRLPSGKTISDYNFEFASSTGVALFNMNKPTVGQTISNASGTITATSATTFSISLLPSAYAIYATAGVASFKFTATNATDPNESATKTAAALQTPLPNLYLNAADGSVFPGAPGYGRKAGSTPYDTVMDDAIIEYSAISLRNSCIKSMSSAANNDVCYPSTPKAVNCYSNVNGTWAPVPYEGLYNSKQSRIVLSNKAGLYYNQVIWGNNCITHSDTVLIVPKKLYAAPVLSIQNKMCVSMDPKDMFDMVATTDVSNGPTEWEWVIRMEDGRLNGSEPASTGASCLPANPLTFKPADFGGGTILNSTVGSYSNNPVINGKSLGSYTVNVSGNNAATSTFSVTSATVGDIACSFPYSIFGYWIPEPSSALAAVNTGLYDVGFYHQAIMKHVYVRYKTASGIWSAWAVGLTSSYITESETASLCNPRAKDFGITTENAAKCFGNVGSEFVSMGAYNCSVDTIVEENKPIQFYATFMEESDLKATDRIAWETSTDGGSTWTTWATTWGPLTATIRSFDFPDPVNPQDIPTIASPQRVVAASALYRASFINQSGLGRISGWTGSSLIPETVKVTKKTNIITGVVSGSIDGTVTPTDGKICVGSVLQLSLVGVQAGATLKWQGSADGATWTDLGSTTTAYTHTPTDQEFLAAPNPKAALADGILHYFRVEVSAGLEKDVTSVYKITDFYVEKVVIGNSGITPTKVDLSQSVAGVCAGTAIKAKGGITNGFMENISFQFSNDGGLSFQDAASEGVVVTTLPDNITFEAAFTGYNKWNGRLVRFQTDVTTGGKNICKSFSDTIELKIDSIKSGTIRPDTICNGQTNTFLYTGEGDRFEWYRFNFVNPLPPFPDILIAGQTGSTASIAIPSSVGAGTSKNEWFRVKASKDYGVAGDLTTCAVEVNSLQYSDPKAPGEGYIKECSIQLLPDVAEMCALSSKVVLTLGVPSAIVSLSYSTDGTTYNVVSPLSYDATSVATDGKIKIKATFFSNATGADVKYSFKATIGAEFSGVAEVTVHPNPAFTVAPAITAPAAVCENFDIKVNLTPPTVSPSTGTTLAYQWIRGSKKANDTLLSNGGDFSGVSTTGLTVKGKTLYDKANFYAISTLTITATGCKVIDTTSVVAATVYARPDTTGFITAQTTNNTSCVGTGFSVGITTKTKTVSGLASHKFEWFKGATKLVSGITIAGVTFDPKADEGGSLLTFSAAAATLANSGTYRVLVTLINANGCDSVMSRSFAVSFQGCGKDELKDDASVAHTGANPMIYCENETLSMLNVFPTNLSTLGSGVVTKIEVFHATSKTGTYASVASATNPASSYAFNPSTVPACITTGPHFYYAEVSRKTWANTYTDTIEYYIGAKADVTLAYTSLKDVTVCEGRDAQLELLSPSFTGSDALTTTMGNRLWYKMASPNIFKACRADNILPFVAASLADEASYELDIANSITRATTTVPATTRVCKDTITALDQPKLTVNRKSVFPSITQVISPATTVCEGTKTTITATLNPFSPAVGDTWRYIWGKGASQDSVGKDLVLTLDSVSTSHQGPYYFRVIGTTAKGCVDTGAWSSPSTLTVNPKPDFVITSAVDQTVCARLAASFTTTANSASSSYKYTAVWQKGDGTVLTSDADYTITNPSATGSSISSVLKVNNPTVAMSATEFFCIITATNATTSCSKKDTSAKATLTVTPRPDTTGVLTTAPASYNGCSGKTWTLSAVTKTPIPSGATSYTYMWFKGSTLLSSGADYTIVNKADNTGSSLTAKSAVAMATGSNTYKLLVILNPDASNCPDTMAATAVVDLSVCGSEVIEGGGVGSNPYVPITPLNPYMVCENTPLQYIKIIPTDITVGSGKPVTNITLYHAATKVGPYTSVSSGPTHPLVYMPVLADATHSAGAHYYYAKISRAGWADTYTDTVEYMIGAKLDVVWSILIKDTAACEASALNWNASIAITGGSDQATASIGKRLWYKDPSGTNTFKEERNDNKLPFTALVLADAATYGLKVQSSVIRSAASVPAITKVCYDTSSLKTAILTVHKKAKQPSIVPDPAISLCEYTDTVLKPKITPIPAQYVDGTTDANVSYQYVWYRTPSGGSVSVISGETANQLALNNLDFATNNGDRYKIKVLAVTNQACNDSLVSSDVTITVLQAPTITDMGLTSVPALGAVCDESSIKLTAKADIGALSTCGSVWQWKRIRAGVYTDINNGDEGGKYTVTTPTSYGPGLTATLEINPVDIGVDNVDEFICVIEAKLTAGAKCSFKDTTPGLSLVVNPLPSVPTISVQPPALVNVCQDSTATYSATVAAVPAGETYTYMWYKSSTSTGTYTYALTTPTPDLKFTKMATANEQSSSVLGTFYYKLVIEAKNNTTLCTDTAFSNEMAVTVASCGDDMLHKDGDATKTEDAICNKAVPAKVILAIAAQENPNSIQWQVSYDGTASSSVTWQNVIVGVDGTTTCASVLAGANCDFTPHPTKLLNPSNTVVKDVYYRAIVTRPSFPICTTNVFHYKVNPSPKAALVGTVADVSACKGAAASLVASISHDAGITMTYFWEHAPKATDPFALVSGATNTTYSIAALAAADTGRYRLSAIASNTYGCKDTAVSNEAGLHMHPVPVVAVITPTAAQVCDGQDTALKISLAPPTAAPTGSSYVIKWFDPSNNLITAANDKLRLEFTPATLADAGSYKCRVITKTAEACTDSTSDQTLVLVVNATPLITWKDSSLSSATGQAAYASPHHLCAEQNWELTPTTAPVITGANAPTQAVVYQWYFKGSLLTDGGRISGATTSKITISQVGKGDEGEYYLLLTANATSCSTSHLSEKISLVVDDKPDASASITQDLPKIYTLCKGSVEDLKIETQTPAANFDYSYEWFKDNVYLAGSNSPSYTLNGNTLAAGAYSYKVRLILKNTLTGCTDSLMSQTCVVTVNVCEADKVALKPNEAFNTTSTITTGNWDASKAIVFCVSDKAMGQTLVLNAAQYTGIDTVETVVWSYTADTTTKPISWTTAQTCSLTPATFPLTVCEYNPTLQAPKHVSGTLYVRAKITRKHASDKFSDIYTYKMRDNLAKISDLAISPSDTTVCVDKEVNFISSYTNPTVPTNGTLNPAIYTWLRKSTGLQVGNTPDFSFTPADISDADEFRLAITTYVRYPEKEIDGSTDLVCATDNDTVNTKLKVDEKPTGGSILASGAAFADLCVSSGASQTLTLSGQTPPTATVLYWQVDTVSTFSGAGSVLAQIPASAGLTAITLSNSSTWLTLPNATQKKVNNYIRAVVKNGCCDSVFSALYRLTYYNVPKAGSILPTDTAICKGGTAIDMCMIGKAFAADKLTWQATNQSNNNSFVAPNLTTGPVAINSDVIVHFGTSTPDTGWFYYRVMAENLGCAKVYSDTARIYVSPQVLANEYFAKVVMHGTPDTVTNICNESGDMDLVLTGSLPSGIKIDHWSYTYVGSDGIPVMGDLAPAAGTAGLNLPYVVKEAFFITNGPGLYRFTPYILSGNCAPVPMSNTADITVYAQPQKPDLTALNPYCAPGDVTATVNLQTAHQLEWDRTVDSIPSKGANFSGPHSDIAFEKGTGKKTAITDAYAPVNHADSLYFIRVKNTVNIVGIKGCVDQFSDTVSVLVKARPTTPILVAVPAPSCCGGDVLKVYAQNYNGYIRWAQTIEKAPLPYITSIIIGPHFIQDSLVIDPIDNEAIAYTFTAKDSIPGCSTLSTNSNTVRIEVKAAPLAQAIKVTDTAICTGSPIQMIASGFKPVASYTSVVFEVTQDTTTDPIVFVSQSTRPGSTSSVSDNYSPLSGGTYFVRYKVNTGNTLCGEDSSAWVKVEAFDPALFSYNLSLPNMQICKGSSVDIDFNYTHADSLYVYANRPNPIPAGTLPDTVMALTFSNTSTPGKISLSPDTTTEYYFMVKNTKLSPSSPCAKGEDLANKRFKVAVDFTPKPGLLTIVGSTDPKYKASKVGDLVNLKLNGDKEGTNFELLYVSVKTGGTVDFSAFAIEQTLAATHPSYMVSLKPFHQDTSYFVVKVSNGNLCPSVYSDTVRVSVLSSNKISIVTSKWGGSAVSNLCQLDTLLVGAVGGSTTMVNVDTCSLVWERKKDADPWQVIASPIYVDAPDVTCSHKLKIKEIALDSGSYQYRIAYVLNASSGSAGTKDTSDVGMVHLDHKSISGPIVAVPSALCVGMASTSNIGLVNTNPNSIVGSISEMIQTQNGSVWSRKSPINQSDLTKLGEIYVAHSLLPDSGNYRLIVKNGACPADTSAATTLTVLHQVKAGNVVIPPIVCYQGTSIFKAVNYQGLIQDWLYGTDTSLSWLSAKAEGLIVPDAGTGLYPDSLIITNLKDGYFAKVVVGSGVCKEDTSKAAFARVYDTLLIGTQPTNQTVILNGTPSATFTIQEKAGGLLYSVNNAPFEVPGVTPTYQWEYSTNHGASFTALSAVNGGNLNIDHYSGANSKILTVGYNFYINHFDYLYRCKVNNMCNLIYTDTAKVLGQKALSPGDLTAATQSGCFYYGDTVVYYTRNYTGGNQIKFRWMVAKDYNALVKTAYTDSLWVENWIASYPTASAKYSAKGDSLYLYAPKSAWEAFSAAGYNQIHLFVSDENNVMDSIRSTAINVCLGPKPLIKLEGDTLCAGTNTDLTISISDPAITFNTASWAIKTLGQPTFKTLSSGEVYLGSTFTFSAQTLHLNTATVALDSAIIRATTHSQNSIKPDTTIYVVLRIDQEVKVKSITPLLDTVCEGQAVYFVGVLDRKTTIPSEVSWQWKGFKEGSSSDHGTPSSGKVWGDTIYGISPIATQSVDSGMWILQVKNSCNLAFESDTAHLVVDMVPALLVQPAPVTVCSGSKAEFTATWKQKDAKTAIQWQKKVLNTWVDLANGANVTGATTVTPLLLTLQAASLADTGLYRIKITSTSTCGKDTAWYSKGAKLTVDTIPLLTIAPSPKLTLKIEGSGKFTTTITNATEGVGAGFPKYTWYMREPGELTNTYTTVSDYLSTHFLYNDSIEANAHEMKIKLAPITLDSTFFFCEVENTCGKNTTDTVLFRVNNRFTVIDIVSAAVCENDTASVLIHTNIAAETVRWVVGKPNGDGTYTWANFQAGGQMDTVSSDENGVEYKLYIKNVAYAYNGHLFAAIFNEKTILADVVYTDTVTMVVHQPVRFTCTNPDADAINRQRTEVIIGSPTSATSDLTYASGACSILPADPNDGSYTYTFAQQGPKELVYTTMLTAPSSAINYTFAPVADTGVYKFYLSIANPCGGDTAYTSVRVLEKLRSSKIIAWADTANNPTPHLPTQKDKEATKPWDAPENLLTLSVCENNYLKLFVPMAGGIVDHFRWEAKATSGAWGDVKTLIPTAKLVVDTLIIDPVLALHNGYQFRLVSTGAVAELSDTSVVCLLQVNPVNNVVVTVVATPNPARENDVVTLTATLVDGAKNPITSGAYIYQWYSIERDGTQYTLTTSGSNTYDLGAVTVLNHDSTQYFCRVVGPCAQFPSDTALLRLYTNLTVDWVPGAVIEPDVDIDTLRNPPTNTVVLVYDDIASTKSTRAYYFSCVQPGQIVRLPAKTLTGIVDPAYCVWEYSTDTGRTWSVIPGNAAPFYIDANTLGMDIDPVSQSMNGYLFRYTGKADVTAGVPAYEDVTSLIELRLSSQIVKGSFTMNGCSDEVYCAQHTYDFDITPKSADYHYSWYLSDKDGNNYTSVNGDSARYPLGKAFVADHGKKVMAVVSNLCGADTLYCTLQIKKPDTVSVILFKDTAICAQESITLTAFGVNAGDSPAYEWFVNGTLVNRSSVNTYTLSNAAEGSYKIGVRLISSLLCVKDSVATDSVVVTVHPRPLVSVSVQDTLLKVGDSTLLAAKVQLPTGLAYTLTWTPSALVKEPNKDTTYTLPMPSNGYYTFMATVVTEFGCTAKDSTVLRVKNNFVLDSIPTLVVIPPVVPGATADTTLKVTFMGDSVKLKVCPNSIAYLTLASTGGTLPLSYTWNGVEVVYPLDYKAPYTTSDSTFGFFLDGTVTYFTCLITDATGATLTAHVNVEYYKPQKVMLQASPKMSLNKYFEKQGIYYSAHPNHFDVFNFYKVIDEQLKDQQSSQSNRYKTSYVAQTDKNNWVYVEVVDKNGCHLADSIHLEILPLPNSMICGDPNYPNAGVIFPEFEVEIYNSWGQVIKEMGKGLGWDATNSDKEIRSGTYYYKVKIPTLDGFTYLNGAVTVFRKNK